MKSFIKIIFGSCLGVVLAIFVLGFLASIATASLMTRGSAKPKIESNSVLRLELSRIMPEKTNNTPMPAYSLAEETFVGLQEALDCIEAAKSDRNIKGIYLAISYSSLGLAKAEAIREAILDFKDSGKFVMAYSGDYGYHQGGYYLASVADEVYLHPLGVVDFRGLGAVIPFFKDMLDKIGVKMEPFYAGKFKSATEPFRRNDMSEENREQTKAYMDELYMDFLNDIAVRRGMSSDLLRAVANNLGGRRAELALENGLVDGVIYEDEMMDLLRNQLDLEPKEDISFISLEQYSTARDKDRNLGAPGKVAIIYAEGEIRNGEEINGMITDDHYVKIIQKVRKDSKIGAVVLRVNSPGGDAFVSDEIWRELSLLQKDGIPVVASMGSVAASGGYYIACGADQIVCEPNTLTGSIGVFGLVPNIEELANDKLGIHVDTVKTGKHALGLSNPFYPIGEEQRQFIQESINNTYEIFLSRVAEGRKMSRDQVHEIAQGRIWTGRKAVEIGLVDRLGNLDDAISLAADLGELSDYRLVEYPFIKDPLMRLVEELTGQKTSRIEREVLSRRFPAAYDIIESLESMLQSGHPQARLPFDVPIL